MSLTKHNVTMTNRYKLLFKTFSAKKQWRTYRKFIKSGRDNKQNFGKKICVFKKT